MKDIFDSSVEAERFSIKDVFSHIFSQPSHARYYPALEQTFSQKELGAILKGLVRFSFYIEPVKQPKIETTKFAVRWSAGLLGDPRYCSYEDCLVIFDKLLNDLEQTLGDDEKVRLLKIIANHSLIAYELNLDYTTRDRHNIHSVNNVGFFWGDTAEKTYILRKYLLNPGNHSYISFFRETYGKVAVKSFLTDRVLTGDYKTNREKRWECHPASVHFALRQECLTIEHKLITQICNFKDFPPELIELLTRNSVVEFSAETMRCPITLEPLSFERFNAEVINPAHGKSSFQVGHMHPLKATGESTFSGHTADNISWISAVGNRIQGDLSVDETRQMILRIINNYTDAGLLG